MVGTYTSIVRRNLGWIVVLAAIIGVAVFFFLSSQTDRYRSQAVIEVTFGTPAEQILGQQRSYEEPQRRVATEAELVTSRPVAELAAGRLQAQGWSGDPASLVDRVEATPRRASNYVEISAVDRTPRGAQAITEAFAQSYLDYRQDLQTAELEVLQIDLLAARDEALSELQVSPEAERAAVQARLDSVNQLLNSLNLRLSLSTSSQALLSPASLPQAADNAISVPTAAGLATLAGTLLALALILGSELLRDSVRTRAEAEALTSLPVLGVLTGAAEPRRPRKRRKAAVGEGERGIRLALQRHFQGSLPPAVVLASLPRDAASCFAAARALATGCAAAGHRVLLISDEAKGRTDDEPQLPPVEAVPAPGSCWPRTSWPAASPDGGRLDFQEDHPPAAAGVDGAVRAPSTTAGVHEANATSTSSEVGIFDLAVPADALADLRGRFDLLLIAAPDLFGLNPADVGPLVDATVPVCTLDRTSARKFVQLVGKLADAGSVLPGTVLTMPAQRRARSVNVRGRRRAASNDRADRRRLAASAGEDHPLTPESHLVDTRN